MKLKDDWQNSGTAQPVLHRQRVNEPLSKTEAFASETMHCRRQSGGRDNVNSLELSSAVRCVVVQPQ